MVYVNVRSTVANYDKWREAFDSNEPRRRAAGSKGVNQVYRDVDNPNTVTIIMEWDNAGNARKFLNDPALREIMQKAGVIGAPAVAVVLSPA